MGHQGQRSGEMMHPSLNLLLTGYFNQDWDLDASSLDEVVASFAKREPRTVEPSIAAISEILSRRDSEIAAEDALREVACQFDPKGVGLSPRAWLDALRGQLERHRS